MSEHLRGLAARGHAKALALLEGPEFPEVLEYLWEWFSELDRARGVSEHGPLPLSYTEILAWTSLTDARPEPHEVEAMMILDRAVLYPPDLDKAPADGRSHARDQG